MSDIFLEMREMLYDKIKRQSNGFVTKSFYNLSSDKYKEFKEKLIKYNPKFAMDCAQLYFNALPVFEDETLPKGTIQLEE